MSDLSKLTDEELFYSVGSSPPMRGGLSDLIKRRSREEMRELQIKHNEAVAEMKKRSKERGFRYNIPRGGKDE